MLVPLAFKTHWCVYPSPSPSLVLIPPLFPKAESLANKMSIAQRLQRSAVKEQYSKKEETYQLRIEKLTRGRFRLEWPR